MLLVNENVLVDEELIVAVARAQKESDSEAWMICLRSGHTIIVGPEDGKALLESLKQAATSSAGGYESRILFLRRMFGPDLSTRLRNALLRIPNLSVQTLKLIASGEYKPEGIGPGFRQQVRDALEAMEAERDAV